MNKREIYNCITDQGLLSVWVPISVALLLFGPLCYLGYLDKLEKDRWVSSYASIHCIITHEPEYWRDKFGRMNKYEKDKVLYICDNNKTYIDDNTGRTFWRD